MNPFLSFVRAVFPTDTPGVAFRSLMVMLAIVGLLLVVIFLVMGPELLQQLAALLTAAGVVFLALGEARTIGTVRAKDDPEVQKPAEEPLNLPGTWLKLIGHGCLVPGALILLFAS